ncbi:TonB-dependent receptor [Chitinophaga sp.]|uniref:SusC/RagA family TonB-linked outer membrane protein n=1 Tax=Chitinophaga sp. TaxID=1869181 RepID=UPI0031DAD4F8
MQMKNDAEMSRYDMKYVLGTIWMLLFPLLLSAQKKPVTGRVTDENGAPLQGVTVMIKNDKTGTTTGPDGNYAISAAPGATLVFSFIGFDKAEAAVNSGSVYNVRLKEKAGSLNDVVVVGYATQKRKDLTGAVGSVNMKDFEKAPVKSFDEALAGRVAGVVVSSNDGQPGSVANIVIRGAGSISQDNSPLYVVDGFPMDDANANSISPADIESIDVLKDASATATYGARGSNGVILITTKKGKQGPPRVSYNGYYGWQQVPAKQELLSPYEFVRYVGEINAGIRDSVYLAKGITLDDYKSVEGVDMQDHIYRTGQNQNHDIAVRGGNDKTRYSLSGNFNNQKGIIINGGFKRYQGRFAIDQTVSSKLKVGLNANYAFTESYGIPVSATNFYASATTLYSVWGYRPTVSLSGRDSAVNLVDEFYDPTNELANNQDYRVNPLQNIKNQLTSAKTNTLIANAYAEYAITKDLMLRVSGGINSVTRETDIFNNSLTQSGSKWSSSGVNGSITFEPSSTWRSENMLTYRKKFGKDHNLTALGVFEAQGYKFSYRRLSATQIPNETLGLDGIDLAPAANTTLTSRSTRWTMASLLARINYDYAGKYLVTASLRADGSSRFAPGNKWGYFPSASVAWRFSAENFMKPLTFVSDAKIRLGYGAAGNNRVGDFDYLAQLQLTSNQYWYSQGGGPLNIGSVIVASANPDLRWETNEQTNLGIDLAFLKNRLNFTADIYQRTTTDLLLRASLPYAHGVENSIGYKNVGKLQNRGLELALSGDVIDTKKFGWRSSFNISFNKNKILSLTEGQTSILSGSGTFFNTTFSGLSPYISVIGRPIGEMYGLVFDGVYQYADFDLMPNGTYQLKPEITANGSARNAIRPGDIKYKDLNGDLVVNNQDYTIIGGGLPKHTGGFSNEFRYGNFDLNVLLQWSYGNDIINANRYVFEGGIVNNPNLNQFASYANRWTPENPSNTLFRAGGMGNAAYSSRVVEDGSYLKLRTVSLGYYVPKAALRRAKIDNMRLYMSAQNLYTWTNYSGKDPEVSGRNGNLTPGFDYAVYPHSLTYVVGLNVTF